MVGWYLVTTYYELAFYPANVYSKPTKPCPCSLLHWCGVCPHSVPNLILTRGVHLHMSRTVDNCGRLVIEC